MSNSTTITKQVGVALLAIALFGCPASAAKKKSAKKSGAVATIDVPRQSADGFDLPPYRRAVLANGLVVLLMEQHEAPIVSTLLTVRSGAAADPAGKYGLAALTAELLTQGTTTRNAAQIATEVDFLGGQLAATADHDSTTIAAEFLAKDVDKQLELVADVSLHPSFPADEVDRVKQQRLAELAAMPEDARTYANAQFEAAVFAGTPYGHPAVGTRKCVEAITRDDVAGFYGANYSPGNAVLAVAGDFTADTMLEKVRATFGSWSGKAVAPTPFAPAAPQRGRNVVVVDYPGLTQTQIRIGAVGIARNDPAFYAIQVANTALGGGFTSRLVEEIRVNRSLSYSAGSRFAARLHPGPYMIATFTKNETVRETIDVALEVVRQFRDLPMPDDELKKAKNYLLGQFPLALETPMGLARMITSIEVNGLPLDYVESFAGKVRALTAAEVSATIKQYVKNDDIVILVFTTDSVTRKQLEGLGSIQVKNYLD